MSQDNLIRLICKDCKNVNYFSTRNRKSVENKIELKKFCSTCKKRTMHKEGKK